MIISRGSGTSVKKGETHAEETPHSLDKATIGITSLPESQLTIVMVDPRLPEFALGTIVSWYWDTDQ